MTWLTRFHTRSRSTSVETACDRLHEWVPTGADRPRRPEETADVSLMFGAAVAVCLGFLVRAIHVYIPQRTVSPEDAYLLCCKLLIQSLRSDVRYERIYNGPGAVIFARRS